VMSAAANCTPRRVSVPASWFDAKLTPPTAWPPWHRQYDADFAAAGFQPRIDRRSTTPQGLLALVAAGVGITRLASSARSLRLGGVRFVPLDGERAGIVLLSRRGASNPALAPFRAVVVDALHASLAGFRPDVSTAAASSPLRGHPPTMPAVARPTAAGLEAVEIRRDSMEARASRAFAGPTQVRSRGDGT
jgi:hypothetical protein